LSSPRPACISLRRDQVQARIRQFVTAHTREANRHGVGKYGLVSLDAPMFADSSDDAVHKFCTKAERRDLAIDPLSMSGLAVRWKSVGK
jgi:hypothetical protein